MLTDPSFKLDVASGDINITGGDYKLNFTSVLNSTTLGSGIKIHHQLMLEHWIV